MGTSTSAAQLGKKFDAFAKSIEKPTAALNKTGLAWKRIATASGSGVIGVKPKGKRKIISPYYQILRDGRRAILGWRGPVHLIANPTKPHDIRPRRPRGVKTRRRGASALTIGGDVRAFAHHPGTRGKKFAAEANATAIRTLPAVFQKAAIAEPLKAAFK